MWKTAIAASIRADGFLAVPAVVVLTALLGACSGFGSPTLRGSDGSLAPCPEAPHCVSSLATDPGHKVEPLRYTGTREAARETLLKVLRGMPRTEIKTAAPDYIHAEFTSRIFRYVDDVEFVLPEQEPVIQVRSSSRIGHSDMGVNRERVESIRAAFDTARTK